MAMRYEILLHVDEELDDDAKDQIAEGMASEASMVLCDIRGGDSGGVKVEFVK